MASNKKLTELDAASTVDFIYGELSGVSKKITSANVATQGSPSFAAGKLLGRGAASGTGHAEAITLGSNLSMSGTTLAAALGPFIDPATYGVVADNSTDDTAALNAMFADLINTSATILWPIGFCKTSDTVTVGSFGSGPGGPQTHTNIMGSGTTESCGINYVGPTDRPILLFSKCTNFYVSDFTIRNSAGSTGSIVGILLSGNGTSGGNQTSNFVFERMSVFDCHIGIQAGGNSAAASEGTFINVGFAGNDIGFTTSDQNSLDFQFIQLVGGFNGVMIDTGEGNGVNVFGGSSSGNTTVFTVRSNATMEIISFRSEDEPTFMTGVGGRVTLQGVAVSNTPSPFNAIDGTYASLVIKDSIILGSVRLDGNAINYLEMTGNYLDHWDTVHQLPAFLPDYNFTSLVTQVCLTNNFDHAFPPSPILDMVGNIGSRNSPIGAKPFYEPNTTQFPIDKSGDPNFGVAYLALNHVRQLSESTMPGSIDNVAPTPGQNLRVSGTFATSDTLAFAFKRALTITGTGDPTITATSGTWLPTDAGKALTIIAAADDGSDWFGYITDYISTTQVNVFPGSATHNQSNPTGAGKAATVGADEPDANYIVAGLCGNANETFWVDTLLATGFTLHSSNATSAATVTALIVR